MNFSFSKYHARGNDYIVIKPKGPCPRPLPRNRSHHLPTSNYLRPGQTNGKSAGPPALHDGPSVRFKISNPERSIAEKSGTAAHLFNAPLGTPSSW